MYRTTDIEIYARWILEEIKKSKKSHRKADMGRIKFWGRSIADLAEQNMCFEQGLIPIHGVDQF